jgi:large subunit ribosomal protein L13
MKTYSAKPTDVTRKWYLVDAAQAPLGRIATVIATYLTGKHKPMYTPHIDCGDHIIVINASKLVVTGNKLDGKKYYHYSGFPGGMKTTSLSDEIAKNPSKVIEAAVKGMLPKNKLVDARMARLKVFASEEHPHTAQQPIALSATNKVRTKKEVTNG